MVEQCYTRHKTTLNPIIDWSDRDVWDFIRAYNIPYCCLYDEGFDRIGCIGCPMARGKGKQKEFARYPKFKNAYMMAFERMLKDREAKGMAPFGVGTTVEDVYHWFMEDGVKHGQLNLFEEDLEEYD